MAKRRDREGDAEQDSNATEFDEPTDEEKRDQSPRVTRAELRAFMGKPATVERARTIVAAKVRAQDVDDVVAEAVSDALATPEENLPRSASIQAWFDRICRRRVAKRYAKAARRKKHEGEMPEAPAVLDEAGEPVEDPGDAVRDVDPSFGPVYTGDDWHAEGWLLRRWMREQVADDPKDRETWAIMEELAEASEEEGATYKKLAERHGMSEAQLYKRMERLREKYRARYERWRNGMVLAWLKWGASVIVAALAIAWVVWRMLNAPEPRPEIRRDPDELRPAPSASASDTPFEPALPTEPSAPPQPPAPTKPPAPLKP